MGAVRPLPPIATEGDIGPAQNDPEIKVFVSCDTSAALTTSRTRALGSTSKVQLCRAEPACQIWRRFDESIRTSWNNVSCSFYRLVGFEYGAGLRRLARSWGGPGGLDRQQSAAAGLR